MNAVPRIGLLAACCLVCLSASAAEPSLTIYNQNFAVVREQVDLDLTAGTNRVEFSEITAHVEPDSVILRDPAGKRAVRILEQNYRADPVSQGLLLSVFEGETIDFLVEQGDRTDMVRGTIVRSGYRSPSTPDPYQHGRQQQADQPIIELNGQLRFGLPGVPLFPALGDDTVIKPTLHWVLETNESGRLSAELGYVTDGMRWEASYNLVAPENGDALDVIGWITMDNQSGRTFEHARVKLMAGDVSRLQKVQRHREAAAAAPMAFYSHANFAPPVQEKTFDEYHIYTVQRPTTLHDRETKQIEFLRASDVECSRFYVYDGAKVQRNQYGHGRNLLHDAGYGTQSNRKVWAMLEFENTEENGLGVPLPKGRTRFYRRDEDGQFEFTGENMIDHTPREETVRVYVGSAFDLVGERRRTSYTIDHQAKRVDEGFEIKLRNRKEEPVEVRVVEHLYRWHTWKVLDSSNIFKKTDSQTIEFRVQVKPDEEAVVTYAVQYTW